ncbi:MAG: hypothetical protein JNJ57_11460 [Saprospiraceae bacterium]|nr:hypothetical protein [Saprospiraceae bacterium]
MTKNTAFRQLVFGVACAAAVLWGCTYCARPVSIPSPFSQCLARFPSHSNWPDTLHCFLADTSAGLSISDTLLKTVLDSAQFECLHFGTGEPLFFAQARFPFVEGQTACILQTEEFWFGKLNLLIFDLRKQKCLAVTELSHFYGGDGGQTASEAWLFRKKTPPLLFVKRADHWLTVSNTSGEPEEHLHQSGQLFQWDATQFRVIANPDSLPFLKRYQMHRKW